MKLHDPSPWARQRLDDAARQVIANAEPHEAEVELGYSRGWTARIRLDRLVIGESHHEATPLSAFRAAMAGRAA